MRRYVPSIAAIIVTVALGLVTWLLGGEGAFRFALVGILAAGGYTFWVTRMLVHSRAIGKQGLTAGTPEIGVGIFLLVMIIILAMWGSVQTSGEEKENASDPSLAHLTIPFDEDRIEGILLQYALPLRWEFIATTKSWEVDITSSDVKDPVFLQQNYALMEDGEFWWKFPAYNQNLQVMVGLNPLVSDQSYYHFRAAEGKVPMLESTVLYGVAEVQPVKMRLYGEARTRPQNLFTVTMGGRLPRDKPVARVALTKILDPGEKLPCMKIPKGYYCRLYVRYADTQGRNFSQNIINRPIKVDPDGNNPILFPGMYLEGVSSKRISIIPMGRRHVSHPNAYTDESETEINSLDSRWLQDEDVIVHVIAPAANQPVRTEVIVRMEPLDRDE